MTSYFLRRLIHGIVVVLGVSMIVFFVTRLLGDPVRQMLPLEASAEEYARLSAQLGFDQSIPVQFVDFLRGVVTLDFGDSLWQRNTPARSVVFDRLPATFALVFSGMALATIIAIPLGVVAALKPGTWLDRVAVVTSLTGLSLPQFWLGVLFIMVFAVRFGWLPTSGRGGLSHLILPAVTLGLPAAGRITQMVRSSMIDQLNEQYVVVAEAKGMGHRYVVTRHALRNAIVPILTIVGWETIRALAGYAVIVETVFAWPGIGFLVMQAVSRQDVVLLQATVFTSAVLIVGINLIVDLLYSRIDPRIKAH